MTLKLERQLSKSWSAFSIGTLRWPEVQVKPELGKHRSSRSPLDNRAQQAGDGDCHSLPCVFFLNSYKFNRPGKKVSHKGGEIFWL